MVKSERKQKQIQSGSVLIVTLVGEAGLEPAWGYPQEILSLSCIPIPPLALGQ